MAMSVHLSLCSNTHRFSVSPFCPFLIPTKWVCSSFLKTPICNLCIWSTVFYAPTDRNRHTGRYGQKQVGMGEMKSTDRKKKKKSRLKSLCQWKNYWMSDEVSVSTDKSSECTREITSVKEELRREATGQSILAWCYSWQPAAAATSHTACQSLCGERSDLLSCTKEHHKRISLSTNKRVSICLFQNQALFVNLCSHTIFFSLGYKNQKHTSAATARAGRYKDILILW